jgi:hypothetical protein
MTTLQITPTKRDARSGRDYLSYQIQYLARELGERPTGDGTQQAYIAELFIALADACDRTAILAALTHLAQRTDPMIGHGGLLLEVLEALARGGLDVREWVDCVLDEVEP